MSGGGWRPRLTFWFTFFSKLHVTFIPQWIAFIFGRDEEENQYRGTIIKQPPRGMTLFGCLREVAAQRGFISDCVLNISIDIVLF